MADGAAGGGGGCLAAAGGRREKVELMAVGAIHPSSILPFAHLLLAAC